MVAAPESKDDYCFTIDEEFVDHVNMYVNGVRALGGAQTYEEWVDTEPLWGIPEQGGTLDASATHFYDGMLDIGDAKFGFTPVDVGIPEEPNDQLAIYAAAKVEQIDPFREKIDKIRLGVFQPKLGDKPVQVVLSRDQLDAHIAKLRVTETLAYELYMTGTPEQIEAAKNPSDEACQWCPIATTCKARVAQLGAEFPIIPAPPIGARPVTYDPGLMSNAELESALTRVDSVEKFIRDWANNLRAEGLRRAQAGKFPGWKVVEGKKGARQVPPADKPLFQELVVADLGADAFEKPELKTPTQLELVYKCLKRSDEWKILQAGYVIQANGQPSLARETEPGVPLIESLANEFAILPS